MSDGSSGSVAVPVSSATGEWARGNGRGERGTEGLRLWPLAEASQGLKRPWCALCKVWRGWRKICSGAAGRCRAVATRPFPRDLPARHSVRGRPPVAVEEFMRPQPRLAAFHKELEHVHTMKRGFPLLRRFQPLSKTFYRRPIDMRVLSRASGGGRSGIEESHRTRESSAPGIINIHFASSNWWRDALS